MTAGHEHFEFLCALAASEALTEAETVTLRRHLQDCLSCRALLLQTTQLTSHLLLNRAFHQKNRRPAQRMLDRFVTRAIAEGVPLAHPATTGFSKLGLASVLLVTLLIVAEALNHNVPARPIADATTVKAAPTITSAAAPPAAKPTAVSLSRRRPVRLPQRSFPFYLGSLQRRDFPVPLIFSVEAPVREKFPAPVMLQRSNALNLIANFKPEILATASRTFEYSGSSIPRFVPVCGCESR
jgi:hypothetical protein